MLDAFEREGGWILLFDDAISHTVVMRKYNAWGIDVLLQIISQDQNLTLIVTDESVGTYFCHAEVEGYAPVTSNPAELVATQHALEQHRSKSAGFAAWLQPASLHTGQ